MNKVNYKEIDRRSIIEYLKSHPGELSVDKLKEESGADKLQVYPLLMELSIDGIVKITSQTSMGAPVKVMFCK